MQRIELKDKLIFYADDIREDDTVLFLSIMNQNKRNLYKSYMPAAILKDVFNWVRNSFNINYPNQPISSYSYLARADKVNEVCRIISAFGTGITDFELVDVSIEKVLHRLPKSLQDEIVFYIERQQVKARNSSNSDDAKERSIFFRTSNDLFIIFIDGSDENKCRTIKFCHGKKNVLFNLEEQSDGTIRILDLLEILLAGQNKTYVIDELDRCLHPCLCYKFVETFLNFAQEKNIQLIVTTHESRLMDFGLLRRDEIWFVDKNDKGESDIYSLEEYNTRFDQKIDKAYLEGRYGGVPIFSTIFPVKEEAQQNR